MKRSTLLKDAVICSGRLHCKIKHDSETGKVAQCKVRLVVQGDSMKKGEDFEDAFALVPQSAAVRTFFSLVAGS